MERPIKSYKLPSGIEVKLYAYLTLGDKEAVLKDFTKEQVDNPQASYMLELEKKVLNKLSVEPIDAKSLCIAEWDYLAELAMKAWKPDPLVLTESSIS